MGKDSKKKSKTPARRRKEESDSSGTPQSTESVDDRRPRKRKRGEDETPRKMTRVSEEAGPSTSCQAQNRTVKRVKRKRTQEGEGPSPLAKRKKKGLLEQVLTKDLPSSSEDTSTGSSSSSPVLYSTETGDIRKRNLKRKAEDSEEPSRRKKRRTTETEEERVDSQRAKFQEKYIELHKLGEGGFGFVFAGYRVEDKLPVAIKHIPKDDMVLKHKDENGRELAMEVAIMLKLRNVTTSSLGQSAMVFLLDWYDLDQEVVVVMERPMPADDLSEFLMAHGGSLRDKQAKIILKQLVEATVHLQNANIFHRDIKVENILIKSNPKDLHIYLIDFGLSCFDDRKQHELFCGTPDLLPLDWFIHNSYGAGPTTVWQVGVVLFEIVHRKMFNTNSFIINKLNISKRLSKKCQDFLTKCLTLNPAERPTLEELLGHPWFS